MRRLRKATAAPQDLEHRATTGAKNPELLAALIDRLVKQVDDLISGGGGGGGGVTPPLWLTMTDATHLNVAFGQVNGITPSDGWAGGGNDVGVDVDVSGYDDDTFNIYVNATLGADGVPTAVEVDVAPGSVPANSTFAAYRLIGIAVISAGAIVSISSSMAWSQEFVTCGRNAADPGTTPGTYFWELA